MVAREGQNFHLQEGGVGFSLQGGGKLLCCRKGEGGGQVQKTALKTQSFFVSIKSD